MLLSGAGILRCKLARGGADAGGRSHQRVLRADHGVVFFGSSGFFTATEKKRIQLVCVLEVFTFWRQVWGGATTQLMLS